MDHIGPLSCTGGVSELARINSLHTSAFSNVAWLPSLVPSSVLGKQTTLEPFLHQVNGSTLAECIRIIVSVVVVNKTSIEML